jgi:hypothetical protein
LATLFLTCVTVAVWCAPLQAMPVSWPSPAAAKASVSGRISAIGDASFSVDVKQAQSVATMTFLIDDDTKFDGKLNVGSIATVDYRTDGGNKIASHVSVKQAAGSQ